MPAQPKQPEQPTRDRRWLRDPNQLDIIDDGLEIVAH